MALYSSRGKKDLIERKMSCSLHIKKETEKERVDYQSNENNLIGNCGFEVMRLEEKERELGEILILYTRRQKIKKYTRT